MGGAGAGGQRAAAPLHIERVDEIHKIALPRIFQQRAIIPMQLQAVPPDMRHLIRETRRRQVRRKRADLAGQQSQPRMFAIFKTFFKQKLHT